MLDAFHHRDLYYVRNPTWRRPRRAMVTTAQLPGQIPTTHRCIVDRCI
jgi:hypothetical protein